MNGHDFVVDGGMTKVMSLSPMLAGFWLTFIPGICDTRRPGTRGTSELGPLNRQYDEKGSDGCHTCIDYGLIRMRLGLAIAEIDS